MAVVDDLDIQRVQNLVESFNWEVTSTKIEDLKIKLEIQKDRQEPEVGKENVIPS